MTTLAVSGGGARRPRGLVLGFVSIRFTLKVWRNWSRDHVIALKRWLGWRPVLGHKHRYWMFGAARSGTTWLMEVLQRGFNLHTVFEPMLVHNPDYPKHEAAHRALITNDISELGLDRVLINDLVAGKFANKWLDRVNPLLSLRFRNGVVLKDVELRLLQIAALMSAVDQSRGVMQPVLILRQPIDTLKSQITAHKIWGHEEGFERQKLAKLLMINRERLTEQGTATIGRVVDRLGNNLDYRITVIANWCVFNLIALEQAADRAEQGEGVPLKTVLYERMVAPEAEARAYLESIFGPFRHDPHLARRSYTDLKTPPGSTPEIERETAAVLAEFGLEPLTRPGQPHLLDLDALVAEYRKPASDRLTPRFTR